MNIMYVMYIYKNILCVCSFRAVVIQQGEKMLLIDSIDHPKNVHRLSSQTKTNLLLIDMVEKEKKETRLLLKSYN